METLRRSVGRFLFPALLLVMLAIQIFPILWVLVSSFKTIDEFRVGSNPFALPKSLYLDNYVNAILKSDLLLYFRNSLIVVVFVLAGILVLSSMAGFALEKLRFRFRKAGLLFFLFGIMVPIQVTLIPLYQIFRDLHLLNTYTSVILPQIGFGLPVSIFLFVSFYKYLPNEVMESAVMDGASMYRLFVSIVLPMAANIVVTVATLYGVFAWNEFIFPFTFLNSKSLLTVTLGLRDYVGNYGMTDWGATFSAIMLTVTPTFIVYFFLSKSIISGMTAGAVKS
ncbi:carbohydrate ABC transporter permease [Cohnella faecalis]|uniref:Carbohydrate ABC transporter permease n=1 Tax=Cohnella faecalis TaxID=2315694 RepID=A0A398CBG1_9BACL|nr:carbohydrate ABC transporter permease [Cohnella faecalis]RIE00327.1 carbohydrate ABC transporter permease [Cohnella faecalis]RIE00333.1 carbohydrate ABC transporter permease [Cohnella faecalis]RIE00496.1 carbohydrate ABC transporter permease [Cohnella faecalis]RIE00927.1 carbohydrate ABC transporter permease [Cohnella faecalis]